MSLLDGSFRAAAGREPGQPDARDAEAADS